MDPPAPPVVDRQYYDLGNAYGGDFAIPYYPPAYMVSGVNPAFLLGPRVAAIPRVYFQPSTPCKKRRGDKGEGPRQQREVLGSFVLDFLFILQGMKRDSLFMGMGGTPL